MASEQAATPACFKRQYQAVPQVISLSKYSNCLYNLDADGLGDDIQIVEFNESGVTDWNVDVNGIHSKTKFEYYKSVPQFKKTIFGLMAILVLTAWATSETPILPREPGRQIPPPLGLRLPIL
ncbi:hypothetical protein THAOC_29361 [Thalassiosira oceanica]|uniref:Uncharacterized protein n=1 Tax=Thalassiosira oceanica TaxID=159749 RepID=K0RCK2_THAOC|nr:hypothetical protein THAOC_29361 [Thalassiosira oceanica]|eukprot:EJK51463.1 hypothetical protein THAOC_29361 [Thalassiosira oceanica]